MARRTRLNLAGLPQHLVQRGNNRGPCFIDDDDREHFLRRLKLASERHQVSIHAYVLMHNHVHMLATPILPDGVSRMMQSLSAPYVQAFNLKHGRTGTMWEGRFHGCLVDSDTYLWRCHRYIERNPVRAGMVDSPDKHRWSSYGRNAHGSNDPVVTPHPLYIALGACPESRALAYRGIFDAPQPEHELGEMRAHLQRQFVLGDASFVTQVEHQAGRIARARRPGRPCRALCPVNGG